ncbi:MAG: hypothetical protein J0L93_07080 [Deltaproteobacteria bacterium]|nr:hypothetical protein [Deltaproteobacteria bacterium]
MMSLRKYFLICLAVFFVTQSAWARDISLPICQGVASELASLRAAREAEVKVDAPKINKADIPEETTLTLMKDWSKELSPRERLIYEIVSPNYSRYIFLRSKFSAKNKRQFEKIRKQLLSLSKSSFIAGIKKVAEERKGQEVDPSKAASIRTFIKSQYVLPVLGELLPEEVLRLQKVGKNGQSLLEDIYYLSLSFPIVKAMFHDSAAVKAAGGWDNVSEFIQSIINEQAIKIFKNMPFNSEAGIENPANYFAEWIKKRLNKARRTLIEQKQRNKEVSLDKILDVYKTRDEVEFEFSNTDTETPVKSIGSQIILKDKDATTDASQFFEASPQDFRIFLEDPGLLTPAQAKALWAMIQAPSSKGIGIKKMYDLSQATVKEGIEKIKSVVIAKKNSDASRLAYRTPFIGDPEVLRSKAEAFLFELDPETREIFTDAMNSKLKSEELDPRLQGIFSEWLTILKKDQNFTLGNFKNSNFLRNPRGFIPSPQDIHSLLNNMGIEEKGGKAAGIVKNYFESHWISPEETLDICLGAHSHVSRFYDRLRMRNLARYEASNEKFYTDIAKILQDAGYHPQATTAWKDAGRKDISETDSQPDN